MSIPTGVDGDAPVRAHHEIDINAPLDTVWQLHADVNAWPAWQTDITAAHINGAFQPGASFEWTSYGFTVVSTIYAVAERARVLWGGTAGGITGVHEWAFSRDTCGRARNHGRILCWRAGGGRRHRDAIGSGQLPYRLARPP